MIYVLYCKRCHHEDMISHNEFKSKPLVHCPKCRKQYKGMVDTVMLVDEQRTFNE